MRALGSEQVTGILLPSRFTSKESIQDAIELAERLHIRTHTLSIKDIHNSAWSEFISHTSQHNHPPHTVAEENLQARIRGLLLMAYSNGYNSTLLTTGNKSEVAVGYCTLYGDMCGALNLIGDLYKTEVYALVHYLNKDKEIIPHNIIQKAPSAELREDQKDTDSLPPYDVLDALLYAFIEKKEKPSAPSLGNIADKDTIAKIWRLYMMSEYKRYQAAPIIKVSSTAFGRGRIVPLVSGFPRI